MDRAEADKTWQQLAATCMAQLELHGAQRRARALDIALTAVELASWAGIETQGRAAPSDA